MKNRVLVDRKATQRSLDLTVDEGTILVKSARYQGPVEIAETEKRDTVRVPVFGTAPARVRVVGSVTRNLGNYNSARVEVMVELPAYPVESEMERAYRLASELVDRWIENELKAVEPGEGGR